MRSPTFQAITLTADVYRAYAATVAALPPETYGMLGGSLDEPFRVTHFKFMPPRFVGSAADASRVHINIDADAVNYIVDFEWRPQGVEFLGLLHSHPPGMTQPSRGDPETREGDIAFFSACLDADDTPGRRWQHCLCPISTQAADGTGQLHGWVLERGHDQAISVPVIIGDAVAAAQPSAAQHLLARTHDRIDMLAAIAARYGEATSLIRNNRLLSEDDRTAAVREMERARSHEMRALRSGQHPISVALGLADAVDLPAEIAKPLRSILHAAKPSLFDEPLPWCQPPLP